MRIIQDATLLGGTFKKGESAMRVVSLWHIPGGTDYDLAQVYEFFFEDIGCAERFQKMYDNLPEMAMIHPC